MGADEQDLATRMIREVLDDHLACREAGDLERDLERNYDDDVAMLTPMGASQGKDGVREAATRLYEAVKHTDGYEYTSIVHNDRVALLEWRCTGEAMTIDNGVDSFLIENGKIRVQTIRYTVKLADLSQAKALG